MKTKWLALIMGVIVILSSFPVLSAAEEQSFIRWGEVKKVTYNGLLDTILMYKDELHDGGFSILTGKTTQSSKEADFVINKYGDMGALQVVELPKEKLEDPTPILSYPLSTGVSAKSGKCYMIVLQDGTRAKIRVDQIANTKAFLSYVLETAVNEQPSKSSASPDSKSKPDINPSQTQPTPSQAPASTTPQKNIELQLDSLIAHVDGRVVTLETSPKLIDGRTMIPLRFIVEALGAQVDWDSKEYRITITLGSDKLVLWVNKLNTQVNSTPILLDVAPQIVNDTTLVPVRFISESLKQSVNYDDTTRKITVKNQDGKGSQPAPAQANSDLTQLFGLWQLVIPGVVIVTPNYFTGYDTVEAKVGALAGSIAINSDGTYVWNSSWDQKVITGTWKATGDKTYYMLLLAGESGADWKVTMMKDGLTLWDGNFIVKKGSKIE